MTVWSHLSTIFNRRHALRSVGIAAIFVALITTVIFSATSHAASGVNQTLSFQGRLLNANGSVAPDGHYNIQFKIYQDGTGTTAGDTGGALKWTETYLNNGGTNGVEVKDGFFSVNLGSITPFGTSVDWNQDTLWLSMNVAGNSTSCSSFGGSGCSSDGEMLPMKRITSTPYALNSGQLGGKTADQFLQLGQGTQTDSGSASSILLNKTGSGNIIQLQNNGTDAFNVSNSGDVVLGSNTSDKSITVAAAGDNTNGSTLTIKGGSGGSGDSNGGDLILQGGDASGNSSGGNVIVKSGTQSGTGTSGNVTLQGGGSSTVVVDNSGVSVSHTVGGDTATLNLDSGSSAPTSDIAGSMYYDSTLGEVQCYEANGWGNCSDSPNQFVTLSPTYTNAVVHSTGTGTLTTDLCSDALNINDGSDSQPTICGTNETYNYYDWTSDQTTDQTRSIYVTYKLPSNFKGFVQNSTSLMARTDSSDAKSSYEIYKNSSDGLTAYSSEITASTDTQTTWQEGKATTTDDPANCDFQPGDSIVFKINLTAKNNANAYVSTLDFALK